jgi:beta-glucosidase
MDFLWGAATSSHQIDGNNVNSDWWHWEKQGFIDRKETSGLATDHWNRFREDLELAEKLKLNSYRFSVEWARVEPREGEWDVSALRWYRELILECEKRSLMPMLTLHHFTLPQWVAEKGGLAWDQFPERFLKYTLKVIEAVGTRVSLWCTVNEPMGLAIGKYMGGFMPPGTNDPASVSTANRNLFAGHVLAYDALHEQIKHREGPFQNVPLAVGFAHNMIDFMPARSWHPMERWMTLLCRNFYNRSWLDAVVGQKQHFGIKGLLPTPPQVTEAHGRRTVDFIGINYYMKVYLRWRFRGKDPATTDVLPLAIQFSQPTDQTSELGWAIYPAGLGRMIRFVKSFGLPIYITENGIADGKDALRPSYLLSHLREIAKSIREGADIRGYYHWSLIDNFEWIKGFEPRFGLIEVDYATFKRTLRPSAELYRNIIDHHHRARAAGPELSVLDSKFFKDFLSDHT